MLSRAGEYGLVSAVSALVAGLVLRPWSGGWSEPIVWRNDTRSVLAMFDAAGWTGSARGSAGLGAPHGTSWIDFPLGPDRLHLVALRLLKAVSGDRVVTLNLYLLLGFVLVAVVAYGVLRNIGVGAPVACASGIVYSLAPYHFERIALGHVFLAAYYAVPLGVLLALWSVDGSMWGPGRVGHRRWWAAAWILVVGSASAYYAAYTLVLVAGLGAAVALRRRSARALVVPAAVAVGIVAVVVANVAGDLLAARSAGTNIEASGRAVDDLSLYALRPILLVAPDASHRVPALADVGEQLRSSTPWQGGAYLGVVATAGLLVLAVRCVRSLRRYGDVEGDPDSDTSRYGLDRRLAVIAAVGVVVSSVGATWVLGAVGFTQIRAWDRISVVIGFIGLCALGPAIERGLRARPSPLGPYLAGVALVAVAVVDQTGALPSRTDAVRAHRSDVEVAAGIEAMVDDTALAFQFPYVAFPGGVTDRGMPMYANLGPWAVGEDRVSYSSGAMQGRGGDWQASWVAREPDVMAIGLAAAGFDVLYVDRRADPTPFMQHTPRSGAETADALAAAGLIGQRSPDGTREWFDLRPLRERMIDQHGEEAVDALGAAVVRPIGVTFRGAAPYASDHPGARSLDAGSVITLRREDDDTRAVEVSFLLSGEAGATVEVTTDSGVRRVILGEAPTTVTVQVPMTGREATIQLDTDAAPLGGRSASAADSRLRLTNLEIVTPGVTALLL